MGRMVGPVYELTKARRLPRRARYGRMVGRSVLSGVPRDRSMTGMCAAAGIPSAQERDREDVSRTPAVGLSILCACDGTAESAVLECVVIHVAPIGLLAVLLVNMADVGGAVTSDRACGRTNVPARPRERTTPDRASIW